MDLVAFVGLANSGKGTASKYLVESKGYKKLSFADTVKDATSIIFNLPRNLLEGDTDESRQYRETVLDYWHDNLVTPPFLMGEHVKITPRYLLQYVGTEIGRNTIHSDIWLMSLDTKMKSYEKNGISKFVIDDVRFYNEVEFLKNMGAKIYNIIRPELLPEWYLELEKMEETSDKIREAFMSTHYPHIHRSEWDLVERHSYMLYDEIFINDGTIQQLKNNIDLYIT